MEPRKARGWLYAACLALALTAAAGAESAERVPLAVQSLPAGAVVIIDGRDTGAQTPATIPVIPGHKRIRMEKAGYKPAEREVEVYTGGGFVSFILEPEDRRSSSSQKTDAPEKTAAKKSRQESGKGATTFKRRGPPVTEGVRPVQLAGRISIIEVPAAFAQNHEEPASHPSPSRKPSYPDKPARFSYRDGGHEKERADDKPGSWSILPGKNPFQEVIAKKKEEGAGKAARADHVHEDGVAATLASLNVDRREVFPLAVKSVRREAEEDYPEALPETLPEETEDEEIEETEDLEEQEEIEGESIEIIEEPEPEIEEAAEMKVEKKAAPESRTADCEESNAAAEQGPPPIIPLPEDAWPGSAETALYRAAADLPEFPEKLNILLLGLDRRDRYGILATGREIPLEKLKRMGGRSDVIMVMQLDFVGNRVKLVSVPRDTQAYIPGRGRRKINSAYAMGGERLARRTVERLLKVEIHRTVVIDWRGAKKCIAVFKKLGFDYKGYGEKEMFWYLRKRSFAGGDFTRIERQQRFVRHGLSELLEFANQVRTSQGMSGAVKRQLMDMAIQQGLEVVETDLTPEEVKLLLFAFRDYDMDDMTTARLRGRGGLFGADEDGSGGVYLYKPYRGQTFDNIVARAER